MPPPFRRKLHHARTKTDKTHSCRWTLTLFKVDARTGKSVTRAKPVNGKGKQTIGGYLIQRLQDYGVADVFGIPGDFVLQFYGMLTDSPIRVVGTTREDCARLRGRRLRSRAWLGSRLRDVLRRRLEPVQFDRRSLRREVAGDRHQRRARASKSDARIHCCITESAISTRSAKSLRN